MTKAVIPLESDPTIFQNLAAKLGLKDGNFEFTDIFLLDDPALLLFVPRPIVAIILLFPIDAEYESLKRSEEEAAEAEVADSKGNSMTDSKAYWFPQQIKNACGLYALLHCLTNIIKSPSKVPLETTIITNNEPIPTESSTVMANFKKSVIPDSKLDKFLHAIRTERSIEERTKLIEGLENEYSESSKHGQTQVPELGDEVDLHFVCFVKSPENGKVYELDGRRKTGPFELGEIEGDDLLEEQCIIDRVKKYMGVVSEANRFKFSLMGIIKEQY